MKAGGFRALARSMYLLTKFQKAVRMGLRAFWSWGAVWLLGWFLHRRFGWFPDARAWFWAGGMVGMASIARAFLPHISIKEFLWRVDRRLGLMEQVSAAWEVTRTKERTYIGELLLKDVIVTMSQMMKRVWRFGWYLRWDVLASIVVVVMLLIVGLMNFLASPTVPAFEPQAIPAAGSDPNGKEIFPSGILGAGEGSKLEEQPEEQKPDTPFVCSDVIVVFAQLGQSLSGQAASYEVGRELEQGNLSGAAAEFETLAGEVGELSPQSAQAIATALEQAARQLQNPPTQFLAEDLLQASTALRAGEKTRAAEALDAMAESLRMVDSQCLGAPPDEPFSNALPADRISGEGEVLVLPLEQIPDILKPAMTGGEEPAVVSPEANEIILQGGAGTSSSIDPYSSSWEYRDVVSEFFAPR